MSGVECLNKLQWPFFKNTKVVNQLVQNTVPVQSNLEGWPVPKSNVLSPGLPGIVIPSRRNWRDISWRRWIPMWCESTRCRAWSAGGSSFSCRFPCPLLKPFVVEPCQAELLLQVKEGPFLAFLELIVAQVAVDWYS